MIQHGLSKWQLSYTSPNVGVNKCNDKANTPSNMQNPHKENMDNCGTNMCSLQGFNISSFPLFHIETSYWLSSSVGMVWIIPSLFLVLEKSSLWTTTTLSSSSLELWNMSSTTNCWIIMKKIFQPLQILVMWPRHLSTKGVGIRLRQKIRRCYFVNVLQLNSLIELWVIPRRNPIIGNLSTN